MYISTMEDAKNNFTVILEKYGLEPDFNRLWKSGVYNLKILGVMQEDDLRDFRLNGTWAQYCNMYKQETGKEHKYAKKAA